MTTLTYTDAYLKTRVSDSVEARAFEDVDVLGTFTAEWRNRLAVIRAYILACLEHGGEMDDTFAVKLGQYRKEWDFVLAQAKRANAGSSNFVGLISQPIERA